MESRHNIIAQARRFERENNWQDAADQWRKVGRTDDWEACLLI